MIRIHMLKARDIMSTGVITIREEASVAEAIRVLQRHGIAGAPVISEHGRVVGMISETDCLRVLAGGAYDHYEAEETQSVERHMTRPVVTVSPLSGVYHMLNLLHSNDVGRLPVIENGRLVGQVSRSDVLRAFDTMEDGLNAYFAEPLPRDRQRPNNFFGVTKHTASEVSQRLRD